MPRTNNPQFSIIIPAYNVEQYISECVESVLAQNFSDFELILVDDGSTDRTGEVCDEYLVSASSHKVFFRNLSQATAENEDARHPRRRADATSCPEKVHYATNMSTIQVIHQPNSGLSAARNAGVKAASGKYLIFLDGDDYLEKGALKTIHENLEPELDLLRFQAQEVFEGGEVTRYPEVGFATTSGTKAFRKILNYHYIENAWLYAYRREFFLENHFQYAEGCVAEDFGLTPLVIAKAERVKAISEICYSYRQRPGSITRGAASIRKRTIDIEQQLRHVIPELIKIPSSSPVLHYLVASFLTSATLLESTEFLQFYYAAKKSGWLKYIHPSSLKATPRAFFLRFFPQTFYKIYRRRDVAPQVDTNRD